MDLCQAWEEDGTFNPYRIPQAVPGGFWGGAALTSVGPTDL